jgi:glucose/arabinose dehydrogenase
MKPTTCLPKLLVFACAFAATAARPSIAQNQLTTRRVASGLTEPVFAGAPPGDTNRLFIVEQGTNSIAYVKILDLATQTVLPTPFLTVAGLSFGGERGLLGLAFHPDYAHNGYFYIYLSDTGSTNSVWRYHVPPATPNVADLASKTVVLSMGDPFANHNGGWIGFGPDGYLYVGTGDGGSGYDPLNSGQDTNSLLGKMLRLDVDRDDFPGDPNRNYGIPPGNPFASGGGAGEVWHYGLRNPWRDSFDRATGDLYIGDVGQFTIEEIDFQPAGTGGLNFGWRCMEGNVCTGYSGCTCFSSPLTSPIWMLDHSQSCAVMGGYVYRGNALCGLQGTYFFADYCSARIWSFREGPGGVTQFTERTAELAPGGGLSIGLVSSFGEDGNGELYICDYSDGEIYEIVPRAIVDCNHNGIDDACDIASGTSLDANGDGIPDECQPATTPCCPGDGTLRSCPCGNDGASGHGCQNSASTGGALLLDSGSPSLSADTFTLTSSGELPTAFTILLQGDLEVSPVNFGDGLRCAGGHMKRLYKRNASAGVFFAPSAGEPSISERSQALGDLIPAGGVRVYQTYYRDPSPTFCMGPQGGMFNASGGVRVRWGI